MSVTIFGRRRRRTGGALAFGFGGPNGGGGLPAGNATLVSDLGGDSAVLAFYDVRNNITSSGGVVDSWADTRGSVGYGPALTASGTARPAYDGTYVTSDGVDDKLTTAADAKFDLLAAKTIVYIGTFEAGDLATNEYAVAIAESASVVRLMGIRQSSGGETIEAIYGPSSGYTSVAFRTDGDTASLASSSNRRLLLASKTGTTGLETRVANSAVKAGTASANQATGNNTLTLFDFFAGGTQYGVCNCRAVLVLDHAFTAGDYTALRSYASAQHSTVETA